MDPIQIMMAVEASERRKKARAEVIHYSPEDLSDGWEFKVVRANPQAFRSHEAFDKVFDQERRAGWIMLEKLDEARVRFKRPVSQREHDILLGPDVEPYRTEAAAPAVWWMLLLVIAVLGGVALILAGVVIR